MLHFIKHPAKLLPQMPTSLNVCRYKKGNSSRLYNPLSHANTTQEIELARIDAYKETCFHATNAQLQVKLAECATHKTILTEISASITGKEKAVRNESRLIGVFIVVIGLVVAHDVYYATGILKSIFGAMLTFLEKPIIPHWEKLLLSTSNWISRYVAGPINAGITVFFAAGVAIKQVVIVFLTASNKLIEISGKSAVCIIIVCAVLCAFISMKLYSSDSTLIIPGLYYKISSSSTSNDSMLLMKLLEKPSSPSPSPSPQQLALCDSKRQ
jgi:uncharacterized membrane protein YidH (DUF202 family)